MILSVDRLIFSGATVIIGSRSDNNRGSAYIFERSTDEWVTSSEVARLSASDTEKFDHSGSSVAVRWKMMVVGARDDDTSYEDTGSAYIFMRQDHNWTSIHETTMLVASDNEENAIFGETVTISGSTVIVGAPWDRGSRGAVNFFEIEQDTW